MRASIALLLCAAMTAAHCAPALATRSAAAPDPAVRAALVDYLQHLAPGSRIRLQRAGGGTLRGTFLRVTDDSVIVQERARIPEPPLEIALDDVTAVEPDEGGPNMGKIIGAAAAAGAAGALAVFLILLGIYSD